MYTSSEFLSWVHLCAVLCQFIRGIPIGFRVRYICKEVLAICPRAAIA